MGDETRPPDNGVGAGGVDGAGGFGAGGASSVAVGSGGFGGLPGVGGALPGVGGGGPSSSSSSSTTGAGGSTPSECNVPADCPGSDTPCAVRTCNGGKCGIVPSGAKGTLCNDSGGTVCDGAGKCVPWAPLSTSGAPSGRYFHTAVWTGSHMVIWGGLTDQGVTGTGYKYDPQTDHWSAISMVNAPAARHSHGAVWTGDRMIVWGGFGANNDYATAGGIYYPASDTWETMTTAGQPQSRQAHAMVFSGTHVIVWGGRRNATAVGSGGRYNVATKQWLPMAAGPSARFNMASTWVRPANNAPNGGMFVYGGTNTFDWFNNGGFYDPVANSWRALSTAGAPPSYNRESASATTYAPGEAFVFGGWNGFDTYGGELYVWSVAVPGHPNGYWYLLQPEGGPTPRAAHTALVPGSGIFVWGGCYDGGCAKLHADGSVWKPGPNGGTWTNFPADPVLSARRHASAVWTGKEAIVWGGYDDKKPLANGARRALPSN